MPLDFIKKTFILDQNARYYGVKIIDLMENAGKGIAEVITKKYGKKKRVGIFCGLGNNGGDGFAAGRYLMRNSDVTVFLLGRPQDIKTEEAKKNWEWFKGRKIPITTPKDVDKIEGPFNIIVEAMIGTRIEGKLKEPFASVVRKISKMKGKKVTIDLAVPGFTPDLTISMHYPKTKDAVTVDIGIPKELEKKTGPGEVQALYKPPPDSHKGENGKLMVIGGSRLFHGPTFLALKTASRIVDWVFYSSVPENNELVRKLKLKMAEVTVVPRERLDEFIKKVDCVLIGSGMEATKDTKILTEKLLKKYKAKKFALDADALKVVNPKLLNKNCVVTPHAKEFGMLFGIKATDVNIKKMAKRYGCVVLLKGKIDVIASPDEIKFNYTGNQGMTKGGTGDVLAGLTAAFACKNDLFLAASAAAFVNGLAGDRLKKKVSYYFNASDLVGEIPKTIKWCEEF